MQYSPLLLTGLMYASATALVAQQPTASPASMVGGVPWGEDRWVNVNGATLHYVDYGGTGETLLLLAGFGDSARVYLKFAPKFTDHFHVLGLTRRGTGRSEWTRSGYDTENRVEDIRAFLDALKINKVHLAGHSLAGDEVTLFASRYPQRVGKLVYFDAIADRSKEAVEESLNDPAFQHDTSDGALLFRREMMQVMGQAVPLDLASKKLGQPAKEAVEVAMYKASMAYRPDYTKIEAPALAFFASAANVHLPQAGAPPEEDKAKLAGDEERWQTVYHPRILAAENLFRREMVHKEIVIFDDASHYVFNGNTQEAVVCMTRAFLLKP